MGVRRDPLGGQMRVRYFGGDTKPAGNTTVSNSPWAGQVPYLSQVMGTASNLYNQNPLGPEQSMGHVAGFTPQQTAAMGQQFNLGMGGGTSALRGAENGVANVAGGGFMTNPGTQYLSSMIPAATQNPANAALSGYANGSMLSAGNPYFQQMAATTLGNTMPGIMSQFGGDTGRADSGLAARAASQGANDAIGGLAYQNYQQGQQNQLAATGQIGQNYSTGMGQAIGAAGNIGSNFTGDTGNMVRAGMVAPSIDAQSMSDLGTAAGVGGQQQQQNQNVLNTQANQYNYETQRPYNALSQYMQSIQGNYGGTQTTPYFQNGTANTLSGLSGLMGLASGIGGNSSSAMFPGALSGAANWMWNQA